MSQPRPRVHPIRPAQHRPHYVERLPRYNIHPSLYETIPSCRALYWYEVTSHGTILHDYCDIYHPEDDGYYYIPPFIAQPMYP